MTDAQKRAAETVISHMKANAMTYQNATEKQIMLSSIKHDQTEVNLSIQYLGPTDAILIAGTDLIHGWQEFLPIFNNNFI